MIPRLHTHQTPSRIARGVRAVAPAAVALLLVSGLGACGGSASSERRSRSVPAGSRDVVAFVGGQSVSKAMLDHWVPIEAIISRFNVPHHPIPRGEVPDPPDFVACVARLRERTEALASHQRLPTDAEFKARCRTTYEATRDHMLQILITFRWLTLEAAAQGVNVTDSEARKHFAAVKHEEFPTEQVFRNFLRYTGENFSDELLLVRMDMISTRLQEKVLKGAGKTGAIKYFRDFPRRWALRTSCKAGYVIPECKQYHGAEPPEGAI